MSILVFIDQSEKQIKKSSLEAASYAAALGQQMGLAVHGAVLGESGDSLSELGNYGLSTVWHASNETLNQTDPALYTIALQQIASQASASIIIFSNTNTGKSIAPRLSARMKAGLVSGAVALPDTTTGFVVKKSVFSGKAYAHVSIKTSHKIISVNPNSFTTSRVEGSATVNPIQLTLPAPSLTVTATQKVSGEISLTEADVVVSGGRGLKGPENWGLVTDLAQVLGAATACSRPVADVHWRPHHEHVGQTGIAIAPNLYIAIGISGAIQHLAGVNRSKTIVVINKDPEAPFFKAADYGIVGDAFEVVPKITAAIQKLKGA